MLVPEQTRASELSLGLGLAGRQLPSYQRIDFFAASGEVPEACPFSVPSPQPLALELWWGPQGHSPVFIWASISGLVLVLLAHLADAPEPLGSHCLGEVKEDCWALPWPGGREGRAEVPGAQRGDSSLGPPAEGD